MTANVGTNSPDEKAALFELDPYVVRQLCSAIPAVLIISYLYLGLASAGYFGDVSPGFDYYDRMAEGFRQGHLYIREAPSPELLAKTDPWAEVNRPIWGVFDGVLYKNHFYMYWGPVPGLMLLAYKVLLGKTASISDQWPTALFMIGRLWAGAAIIASLASRVRIRPPVWACTLAIVVFGLANPTPFIVGRPHVYEASLCGGQCFLYWGLFWAFRGLESRRFRRPFLLLSSLSLGLACGSRVTNVIPSPLIVAITAAFVWHDSERSLKGFMVDCLAIGTPLLLSLGALGAYNYVRFDSVTEFGVNYQLTSQAFWGSPRYIIPNIFSYLFAPLDWSCRFPFIRIIGYRQLSTLIEWPPGYQIFERCGGIMKTSAFCWLALLCVWQLAEYGVSRFRGAPRLEPVGVTSHELWLLSCSFTVVLSMAPVLSLWEASMRYVEDALGGILMMATVGAFWVLRRTFTRRLRPLRVLSSVVVVTLGVATCIAGPLIAITTAGDDQMNERNPELFEKLDEALSFCGRLN